MTTTVKTRDVRGRKNSNYRHGHTVNGNSRTMATWSSMRTRCSNKKDRFWHRYGGRGIKVCERWEKFQNFLEDVGPRPSKSHSLDRFPNNKGNYEPGNVRWATPKEQMRNRTTTIVVTLNGKRSTLPEIADSIGVDPHTFWLRWRKHGLDRAIAMGVTSRSTRVQVTP